MTPKNIHYFILSPKHIHFSEKKPKHIEIQNFKPQKMVRVYVYMKIAKYPHLLGVDHISQATQKHAL